MAASERSLRELVEKWLDTSGAASARIQLQPSAGQGNRRCICVEAQRETGTLTLFSSVTATVCGTYSRLTSGPP